MSNLSIVSFSKGGNLSELTLKQLFEKAEKYGRVSVYSSDKKPLPARYHGAIKFETSPGSTVEVDSDYDQTIEDAFVQAIDRAQGVVETMKGL